MSCANRHHGSSSFLAESYLNLFCPSTTIYSSGEVVFFSRSFNRPPSNSMVRSRSSPGCYCYRSGMEGRFSATSSDKFEEFEGADLSTCLRSSLHHIYFYRLTVTDWMGRFLHLWDRHLPFFFVRSGLLSPVLPGVSERNLSFVQFSLRCEQSFRDASPGTFALIRIIRTEIWPWQKEG